MYQGLALAQWYTVCLCLKEDLPEKAQYDDGNDERYKRHGVANGVSDSHRAQKVTLQEKD